MPFGAHAGESRLAERDMEPVTDQFICGRRALRGLTGLFQGPQLARGMMSAALKLKKRTQTVGYR